MAKFTAVLILPRPGTSPTSSNAFALNFGEREKKERGGTVTKKEGSYRLDTG